MDMRKRAALYTGLSEQDFSQALGIPSSNKYEHNHEGYLVKNVSLLYSADMQSIRLAPAYDIVSTIIYDSSTREMAFSIGIMKQRKLS